MASFILRGFHQEFSCSLSSALLLWAVSAGAGISPRASCLQLPHQVYSHRLLVLSLLSLFWYQFLISMETSIQQCLDGSVPGMKGGCMRLKALWREPRYELQEASTEPEKVFRLSKCHFPLGAVLLSIWILLFFVKKNKQKPTQKNPQQTSEIVRLSFLNSTSCILFWSVWFKSSNLFSCTLEILVLIYHPSVEKWLMTVGSALQAVFINGSEKQHCMYLHKKIK